MPLVAGPPAAGAGLDTELSKYWSWSGGSVSVSVAVDKSAGTVGVDVGVRIKSSLICWAPPFAAVAGSAAATALELLITR